MKKKPPEFIFLKDEPRKKSEVSYEGFYHATIAPALKKILKDSTSPHTIGLFGAWGTGKSTVVEMVQNDPDLGMPVFIFDAWKYQEDTLRRTFLIKLVEYLRKEGYDLPDDILVNLYSSKTLSITKKQKSHTEVSTRSKIWVFVKKYMPFILSVLLLIGASVLVTFYPKSVASQFMLQLSTIVSSIAFLAVFGKPILEGVLKVVVESFFSKQEQQTELITEINQEDRLNSPEQFEQKFIDILSRVDKKLVIVFDNIDRVQGDVAITMLSTIKTFMYSGSNGDIVFLVPCDPTAIEVQVEKYFYGVRHDQDDSFGAAEYLRKIFNLIIWIPDFINTDLEEYTKSLLKETGEIGKQLNDEDVILVINAAFSRNPREIIQFINNLIAMVISTQGTGVKDIINSNIAYLAKVLIIRQKFPKAYESLKETWHSPENITNGGSETGGATDFTNFMRKTSRITVDDAEPFIYFKDPADSRGLSNANDIKNAFVAANVTEAIEAANNEAHDKLVEFMTDLVMKYTGQENILINVVNTQLEVIASLGIDISSRRYVNEVAKTIDTELWQKYESFTLDHIFSLLANKNLNRSLRSNIVERYISALDTGNTITTLRRGIIANFKDNPSVLNKQQMTNIRSILEAKYGLDEETLAIFTTDKSQESFITEKLVTDYIKSFDFDNLATKLATMASFKEYISSHGLVVDIVSRISELLKQDTAASSRYGDNKIKIVEAITPLTKTFSNDMMSAAAPLTEIANDIIKSIPYTSQWEERSDQIVALYWIRQYVNETDKQAVRDSIKSYFQSFTDLSQIQRPLDYWNEPTRERFIRLILPTILPQLSVSATVLRYIYDNAADEEKKAIIDDLISRVPVNNYFDIDFIATLSKVPARKETLAKLLDKAGANSYTFKSKYLDFIASRLLKSDTAELKTALEQIKSLIMSGDPEQSDISYNFLVQLQFLEDTDRRRIATELLAWLREPGRSISSAHRIAFQVINDYYPLFQDTPKNDYIYLLFSLLTETQDAQMIQIVVNSFQTAQPNYRHHRKDFDDLLSRMQSWSNTQAKQDIFNALPAFANGRQSNAEKSYWANFNALYTEEES